MIKVYECTQCGSTDFQEAGVKRVRCAHCGSLFRVVTTEPALIISKGANVVFGRNANVEVRGDVEIESGANVDFNGKVTLLRGNKKQQFRLELIPPESKKET
jgi:DNA-directed RNA polymerase subunit RPC12/RpoP